MAASISDEGKTRSTKSKQNMPCKKKWSLQETADLIQMYEEQQCLYNTKIEDYKNRDKRSKALDDIAAFFSTTVDEVKAKINSLRSQYKREKDKTAQPKSGSGANQNIKSTWVHFEALHFLREFMLPKSSRSNLPQLDNQDVENDEDNSIQSLPETQGDSKGETDDDDLDILSVADTNEMNRSKSSTKRPLEGKKKMTKRQRLEREEDTLLKQAASALEKMNAAVVPVSEPNTDDLFGKYIVSELKTITDISTKKILKHKIQNLIFEAQMPAFGLSQVNHQPNSRILTPLLGPRNFETQGRASLESPPLNDANDGSFSYQYNRQCMAPSPCPPSHVSDSSEVSCASGYQYTVL